MPELPEVETVRRGLAPVMDGARFVQVVQRRPDLRFPLPVNFVARLEGQTLVRLDRRAKYLVGKLSSGEVLVMHLGMSGRFTIHRPGDTPERIGEFEHDTGHLAVHDHVVFHLSIGVRVVYNDPRRFGFMLLLADGEIATHKLFVDLGPEPLGNAFHAAHLAAEAQSRSVDLKAFLLDQTVVAGLGNIYVVEALHRAGISPNRSAKALVDRRGRPTDRAERLTVAIRAILEDAISAGGSTLRDYRHADGALGYFQHTFQVYGRDGEPCLRPGCRGIVRRSVQCGRSTFFCGTCQR